VTESYHSIRVDRDSCRGCVLCMKACPTKAIRVKNGKAVIIGQLCVDCGECFRVCPHKAIIPLTTSFSDLVRFKVSVAIPSPSLYTQFGKDVMPNQILLALKKIGFDYVYDVAWMCEMVNAAIEKFLDENPQPKPKISTVCPSVIRLITLLYPDLVDHIIPIDAPRELAGKLLRYRLAKERNITPEDIGIIHITTCPAKMVSITNPVGLTHSALDGAVSVSEIYGRVREALKDIDEDEILHQSSGVGLGWAVAGGEINGINMENSLAVSGVSDVIQILDDVEAGKLGDIKYLECTICPDGCVGGPQNVENRHLAKKRANSLVKMFGEKSRISHKMIQRFYKEGFFALNKTIERHPFPALDKDPARAIEKRKKIEEILQILGGKECGACGAPDCRTLARDVVMGEAKITDCVFVKE